MADVRTLLGAALALIGAATETVRGQALTTVAGAARIDWPARGSTLEIHTPRAGESTAASVGGAFLLQDVADLTSIAALDWLTFDVLCQQLGSVSLSVGPGRWAERSCCLPHPVVAGARVRVSHPPRPVACPISRGERRAI